MNSCEIARGIRAWAFDRSEVAVQFVLICLLTVTTPTGSAQADPYDDFAAFADTAFVASADSLILERFGSSLGAPSGWWEYVSETSVAVGFTSNLPAVS